ncbi:hypothetical protein F183_A55390 (plasmid) [Bryobacterales bacterium F-183]|nr:hypothetical protein F183_A55390 [Bryobacterales bacterium F-183]
MHSRVSVVSRASRSATAAAAYISRECIKDERSGLTHDYRRRGGVEFTAMLAEEDAPDWATDRARLWNEAERREKHPRAQTARGWQFTFPYEFNEAQRREAGLKIMQEALRRYGGAVDGAWHQPDEAAKNQNWHIHMLQTTRRFENGQWAATKDRVLDDRVKGPEEVSNFRAHVAGIMNAIATRENLQIFVEYLSFEARGMDKQPTQHLGPLAAEMEREKQRTERGNQNREIQAANEQRKQLREENKVIDIALAKEELRKAQAPPLTEEERFQKLYQEAYAKRAANEAAFEQRYGQQEKELRQEVARLQGDLSKGGFAGMWRTLTGRTRTDRDLLNTATLELSAIREHRQVMLDALERDRQQRFAELRQEQERRAAQQAQQPPPLPRAVGETITRPQEPVKREPANTDRAARRREFFRQQGEVRKQQRQQEEQEAITEKAKSGFDKAAGGDKGSGDRAERRREFFKQSNTTHERGPTPGRGGPSHER